MNRVHIPHKTWSLLLLWAVGCVGPEEPDHPLDSPPDITLSSDAAAAFLSCKADHYPLVNPIVIVVEANGYDVPLDKRCAPESQAMLLQFNDAPFLSNPLGTWFFSGENGSLSLNLDDDTPRWMSQFTTYTQTDTSPTPCHLEHTSFAQLQLNVTYWDWQTLESTYDGTLVDGRRVSGQIAGAWLENVADCD